MSQENVEIARRALEEFNQQFNAEKLDLIRFAPTSCSITRTLGWAPERVIGHTEVSAFAGLDSLVIKGLGSPGR
jgi:hypothetical protein